VLTAAILFAGAGCDSNRLDVLVVGVSQIDATWPDIQAACEDWAEDLGARVSVAAPALPTAADQQKTLEDNLSEDWDIICIEPLGSAEISPLLEDARDRGALIITMRGYSYPVADYNVEPFSDYQMGQRMMTAFAKAMGSTGAYTTLLPSFDAASILDIENAAVQLQKQQHPDMMLSDRLAVTGGKAEEALSVVERDKTYYGIKGVMFFTATDGMGVAGQTTADGSPMKIIGLGDAAVAGEAVTEGKIDTLFYWDRVNQYLAGLEVGRLAYEGHVFDPSADSESLGIDGYRTFRYMSDNTWVGTDIRTMSAGESAEPAEPAESAESAEPVEPAESAESAEPVGRTASESAAAR
jgi:simple sugar transport system substrate-binding protein/rhamnose transport system substrate-binding protein